MSKNSSRQNSASTPARTSLPFDFTPEAKQRIRARNAERRAKGLPLTTLAEPGAFGATPLFPKRPTPSETTSLKQAAKKKEGAGES